MVSGKPRSELTTDEGSVRQVVKVKLDRDVFVFALLLVTIFRTEDKSYVVEVYTEGLKLSINESGDFCFI